MKKVYVGMVADIIHHGHINILNIAASYGIVTVGLLTDNAVKSYKRNPIISYTNRLQIIKSIKYVNDVIPQETHDYTYNLKKLKPDFVIHGSDWKIGPQAEIRKNVIELISTWGGKLIEPEYTSDISTTDIINKIIKNNSS
jgi:phosphoenolpyruvate phosphomutase